MVTDFNDPLTKVKIDLTVEETKVLASMENWAATLFVTAIALVTKQLFDWSNDPPPTNQLDTIPLTFVAYLFPAVIGLVAFLVLRIINYRIRKVRNRQYKLFERPPEAGVESKIKEETPRSYGLVGWSMAALPLFFGFACSAYFVDARPLGLTHFIRLSVLAMIFFVGAICFFNIQSREHRKNERP